MKKHIRDVRLFNNAGISFPMCQANARLLDLDKSVWPTTGDKEATCKNCIKAFKSRYVWAMTQETQDHFDAVLNS